jgi:hypothetical protein
VAEWVSEPLVLVTVIVNLPDLTDDGTVIDSVDVADPPDANVSDVGLTDTVQPLGVVTVRDTVPLNMLSDFSVIAEVPLDPGLRVREDGDAETEKSGATTVTVTVAEWLNKPLLPITVTVYVPAVVPAGTVMDSVDVADPPDAGVTEIGLTVVVQPVGAVPVSATALLNVLSEFTVIVEVPTPPALMFRADGEV